MYRVRTQKMYGGERVFWVKDRERDYEYNAYVYGRKVVKIIAGCRGWPSFKAALAYYKIKNTRWHQFYMSYGGDYTADRYCKASTAALKKLQRAIAKRRGK